MYQQGYYDTPANARPAGFRGEMSYARTTNPTMLHVRFLASVARVGHNGGIVAELARVRLNCGNLPNSDEFNYEDRGRRCRSMPSMRRN
jgi:hypothetical protein